MMGPWARTWAAALWSRISRGPLCDLRSLSHLPEREGVMVLGEAL